MTNNSLCIIPARGGSKRIPNKNKLHLNGVPLINWTINVAIKSQLFDYVLVSTDDAEIAKISIENGANVPWLRPAELSTDDATSIDVVIHSLDWYLNNISNVDSVVLLQPTSPFRTIETVISATNYFNSNPNRTSLVSVSKSRYHPWQMLTLINSKVMPFNGWNNFKTRSSELAFSSVPNGLYFASTVDNIYTQKSFYVDNMDLYITDNDVEALDIDTYSDWKLAEYFIKSNMV